jgi:hypothetical protein
MTEIKDISFEDIKDTDIKNRIKQEIKEIDPSNTGQQTALENVRGLHTSNAHYGISDGLRRCLFDYGSDSPDNRYVMLEEVSYKKYLFYLSNGNEDKNKRIIIEYVFTTLKNKKKWLFYRVFYTLDHYTNIYRVTGKDYTDQIKNL